MTRYASKGILIRRIAYGDYDFILTYFTLNRGKISGIAKAARKSKKRFGGTLDLFSESEVVFRPGKGMLMIEEAALLSPFSNIRDSIRRTAYAGYWAELIDEATAAEQKNEDIYQIYRFVLESLDGDAMQEAVLSILFQMRFMATCGLRPNLHQCLRCGTAVDRMTGMRVAFDLPKGGIVCRNCVEDACRRVYLAKGTIKQLLWMEKGDLATVRRVKFTAQAIEEGLSFLESFVPYHIGREIRSLRILNQVR